MGKVTIKQVAKSQRLDIDLLTKIAEDSLSDVLSESLMGDLQIDDRYTNQLVAQAKEYNEKIIKQEQEKEATLGSLIVTSGYDVQGYRIIEYREFITAESVFGMGVFKGTFASVSDLAGTESEALNTKIQTTRELALNRLKEKALSLDCNAIIGADLDMTMFGDTLLGVVINGTAVVIEPIE